MSTITREDALAGAAGYTKFGLAIYDWLVLGLNTPFVWRCPNQYLVDLYDRHVSANHLDIGVGSGYFLDHCRFPTSAPRLALMDLNPNCLERCVRRLARYRPETHLANVLEPLDSDLPLFDSVGMTYLLHCLPGTIHTKGAVFDHVKAVMRPGAVLFGATVLQGDDIPHGRVARKMLASLNEKRHFSNSRDDLDGLKSALAARFAASRVELVGGVGVFWARP